jgi:hypothetical protein
MGANKPDTSVSGEHSNDSRDNGHADRSSRMTPPSSGTVTLTAPMSDSQSPVHKRSNLFRNRSNEILHES